MSYTITLPDFEDEALHIMQKSEILSFDHMVEWIASALREAYIKGQLNGVYY